MLGYGVPNSFLNSQRFPDPKRKEERAYGDSVQESQEIFDVDTESVLPQEPTNVGPGVSGQWFFGHDPVLLHPILLVVLQTVPIGLGGSQRAI